MNTTGKKFGGRQKGTPNKLSNKIKEKLSKLIDEVIASFDIEDMTKAERLKQFDFLIDTLWNLLY